MNLTNVRRQPLQSEDEDSISFNLCCTVAFTNQMNSNCLYPICFMTWLDYALT